MFYKLRMHGLSLSHPLTLQCLLNRENYWFANNVKSAINNGLQCFDPSAETCTFFIAFCHPLQRVNDTAACPEGAAVCQISKNANGNISSYSLGQFSNTTQFYESKLNYVRRP